MELRGPSLPCAPCLSPNFYYDGSLMISLGIIAVAALVAVLFPMDLYAWGPITHLDYASEALKHVSTFPTAIQAILRAHPQDFLYGTLAADITVGKSYVDYIYNCHNWRVGFLLLNESKDERQKACAYGYLTHLAADIVAHNYFVPATTIRSYSMRALGHVYWEMRFDSRRPKKVWNLAKEICATDYSHDDELFQRMLKRTLFSFKTNKRIFNSILNLHKLDKWRGGMQQLDRKSKWLLTREETSHFRELALESVIAFLQDPDKAPCTKVDPTGADKILYATETRRRLHRAYRHKKLNRAQADEFVQTSQAALHAAIYKEAPLPEVGDLFNSD